MEIKDLGGNKIGFMHGDVEGNSAVVDGTDQPSKSGGTVSMKWDGPDKLIETFKRDGKVTEVDTCILSSDGKQQTEHVEEQARTVEPGGATTCYRGLGRDPVSQEFGR
jgi:YD repeat-containing protein